MAETQLNNNRKHEDEKQVKTYQSTGDLQALGKLYLFYMPLVYGVCLKYFKNVEDSKDAVMHIFEQLVHKLKKHEVKNFKSWLYILSKNHCLMELRKQAKHHNITLEEEAFMDTTPFLCREDTQLKERQLAAMEKCLEKLPPEQKTSVNLFYLQQKCYAEVAKYTGFEQKKVKSYIQNGKRNLKNCIEQNIE